MARAVELAQGVRTTTSPNPWVGSVVVDAAGEVVGEGATAPPGGPHAEIAALAAARRPARGGTVYVDSRAVRPSGPDPALHRCPRPQPASPGSWPRVADPDPNVSGAGLRALEAAGSR